MLAVNIRFLAEVDKKSCRRNQNRIIYTIRSLAEMPERFSFFNEPYIPPNKYRKMFIPKWYLVLYQI